MANFALAFDIFVNFTLQKLNMTHGNISKSGSDEYKGRCKSMKLCGNVSDMAAAPTRRWNTRPGRRRRSVIETRITAL